MSKYLYLQDLHIQGINSCNYVGNYFQDSLIMVDEIIDIAKQNKCKSILDGGDFLEVNKPAYSILDEVADRIENAKIPMYSIIGNHALRYGHIENSTDTGMIHLQKRSSYFHYLDYFGVIVESETEITGWEINPIEYSFNIEEKIKKEGIFFDESNTWKVAIAHAMILPNKFFKDTNYVQCKDIKTNADLVLVAHYHHPFKKIIGNTTFLNIGCVGRLNINEANIEPSVLLIDTDKRSYEIIKLKSARKGSEIFDLVKHEQNKENEKDISEFLEAMENINLQESDISGQIIEIAKNQNVEEKVINHLRSKIERCVKNE